MAQDVADFKTTSNIVTFPAGALKICTSFNITDDKVIEDEEQFEVIISIDDPQIEDPDINPIVKIVDDDGKLISFCCM